MLKIVSLSLPLPVNLTKEIEPRSSNGLLLKYMLILANLNPLKKISGCNIFHITVENREL